MEEEQIDLLLSLTTRKSSDKRHDARVFLRDKKFWDLHESVEKRFVAYNSQTGKILKFVKSLAIQADQNVYLVLDDRGRRWVLKWEVMGNGMIPDTNVEVAEYQRLESMGAQCPKRLKGYRLLWFEVLVLEFLDPLDRDDDVIELAKQLISTQLFYIHQYGCHSDLKPDNIRKRPPTKKGGKPTYFIIDMNLSKSKLGIGYQRVLYTPIYTSQIPPVNQETRAMVTYKNDLLELYSVMNALFYQRMYESRTDAFSAENIADTRQTLELEPLDFVADPITMTKHPIWETRRGYLAVKRMLSCGLRESYYAFGTLFSGLHVLNEIIPSRKSYRKLIRNLEEQREGYLPYRRGQDEAFANFADPSLHGSCTICSSIADYKCGYCYHKVTPLCEDIACRQKHQCF